MNIALYGGTFNPVHNGHLTVAQEVHRLLEIDAVVFLPAYIPPHKPSDDIVAAEHRLAMLQCALAPLPFCTIEDIELRKQAVCYTIDTVRELKQKHPAWGCVYFVIGSDSVPAVYSWKDAEALFAEVTMVVVRRPQYPIGERDDRFRYLENREYDSASCLLRENGAAVSTFRRHIPAAVMRYIEAHQLYGITSHGEEGQL